MVFSRFLSMTLFIPAENTRHSEKPGQNPVIPHQLLITKLFYFIFFFQIENRLPRSEKLKTMMKQGVPHSLRSHMWPRLCGAFVKKANADTSYKDIVRTSSNDHLMTSKQIEKVCINETGVFL
jgi:hypothetical protein